MATKASLRGVLSFIGAVAGWAASALGPWLSPLFNLHLISDYFQPELNGVASLGAFVAFVWTYAGTRRWAQYRQMGMVRIFLAIAAAELLVCVVLQQTVGVIWAPGRLMTIAVRVFWLFVYLTMFASLAIGLCSLAMLAAPKDQAERNDKKK